MNSSPKSGDSLSVVSFHSISFPSEWGHDIYKVFQQWGTAQFVSIQLVSPASGDFMVPMDVNPRHQSH